MTSEALILGENPPQRHRDHPQIAQISQIPKDQICANRRNLRICYSWYIWGHSGPSAFLG
jgi:hypothetical protein